MHVLCNRPITIAAPWENLLGYVSTSLYRLCVCQAAFDIEISGMRTGI